MIETRVLVGCPLCQSAIITHIVVHIEVHFLFLSQPLREMLANIGFLYKDWVKQSIHLISDIR